MRGYPGTRGNCRICGVAIGHSGAFGLCGSHYGRLRRHGDPTAGKAQQRPWTEEEDAYLLGNYAMTDTRAVCRRLRRSVPSVYTRVERLGIGKADADGWTAQEVAGMLGAPVTTVRTWLALGHLRGRRVGKYWRVSDAHLRAFLASDWGDRHVVWERVPDKRFLEEIMSGRKRAA